MNSRTTTLLIAFGLTACGGVQGDDFETQLSAFSTTRFHNLDTHTAGGITETHLARIGTASNGNGLSVTAVRLTSGQLKIIGWETDSNGNITRKGSHTAGAINYGIEVITLDTRQFVTAVRLTDNRLKLILWGMDHNGSIIRRGSYVAGQVKKVALTFVKSNRFITAVRLLNNDLKLIGWHIQGTDIYRGASVLAGGVTDVSATSIPSYPGAPPRIVTAVRLGNGALKLITWSVHFDGVRISEIERGGSALAGGIRQVKVVHVASNTNNSEIVATAVKLPDNRLKVIAWAIQTDGAIARKGSAVAWATDIPISAARISVPNGPAQLVTAAGSDYDQLLMIPWDVRADGSVERGSAHTYPQGPIESVSVSSSNLYQLMTAIRDERTSALKLATYRIAH